MSACLNTLTTTTPTYRTAFEIVRLVGEFEAGELPREKWTHAAHLTVALWYHLNTPAAEVTNRVRAGIKRYNAAHGIVTTPTGGYHETMTLFWIAIVAKHLRESSGREHSFVGLANSLIERYGDKNLPFIYYTRERLFSTAARAKWHAPDLKAI